jgi:hypothetical protein
VNWKVVQHHLQVKAQVIMKLQSILTQPQVRFHLIIETDHEVTLSIYSAEGQMVVNTPTTTQQFDISFIASGDLFYFDE